MNVAFTICSNNYLAHAKVVGDSFLEYHPDFIFIIGLVDRRSDAIDYSLYSRFTIIPVEELNIAGFDALVSRFNITELNTAVKPSFFHFIFKKYNAANVIYLDPDILVTSRFKEVIEAQKSKNIVLTPHICSPIPSDGHAPEDFELMRGGIFNLGFIALSDYAKVTDFLNWWHDRVCRYGFADYSQGMFYDQVLVNYVPVFYDNYYILRHPGYNMANWNLHERLLSVQDGVYIVNDQFPLRFFHFSSYRYHTPDILCHYQTRYNFTNRPDVVPIFNNYYELLKKNKVEIIRKMPVHYYPDLYKLQNNGGILYKAYGRIRRSIKVLVKGHI